MILNHQRRVPIPAAALSRFLSRVRCELDQPRAGVTICFLTDAEIAGLNRRFRGKNKPTDVLSFPAREGRRGDRAQRTRRRFLGEVAISPQAARRNALRLGRSVPQELRILVLHGTLHLLGYDHETDNGRMERLEARLRRRLGID
jgi:probable rRNA maturation factor